MSEREATISRLREKAAEESETEEETVLTEEQLEEILDEVELKKSSTREYVVLVYTGQAWKELGRATASTSDGAIRDTLGDKLEANVEYVAVPVRSWKPSAFEVETKTTFKRSSK